MDGEVFSLTRGLLMGAPPPPPFLIYLSYLTKKMQDEKLFKDFTMHEVLDELDVIECFERPGKRLEVGEMTIRQKELYAKLGVEPPASLQ